MSGLVIAGEHVPEAMIPVLRPERAAWKRKLQSRDFNALKNAMAAAYERLDLRIQQHIAGSGTPVACRTGCAWCCRGVKVEAHAPEVLVIAERIASDQRLRAVVEAVACKRRTMKMTELAASREPCPFLDHDRCGIYDVRPMTCRNHCCTDVTSCKRAFEHPDARVRLSLHMPAVAAASVSMLGMRWAFDDLGLDLRNFELTNAVSVALQQGVASRWLDGERVFDLAVRPVDAEQTRAQPAGSTGPSLNESRAPAGVWKSRSKKKR